MESVREQVEKLEARLNQGWDMIEQRRVAGEDVRGMEDFWIKLLHQYETSCDQLIEREEEVPTYIQQDIHHDILRGQA